MSTDPLAVLFRDAADELAADPVTPPIEAVRRRAADSLAPMTRRRLTSSHHLSTPHRRPARPRTRWTGAVLGLAASALAVLLAVQTVPGPDGSARPLTASAAVVVALDRAAVVAAAGPAAAPGKYMLVESFRTVAHTFVPAAGGDAVTYLQDQTVREWVAVDGEGDSLTEITYGNVEWPSPEDRTRVSSSEISAAPGLVQKYRSPGPGNSELPPGQSREVREENGQRIEVIRDAAGTILSESVLLASNEEAPNSPTYRRLLELPTDPAVLYAEITRDAGDDPEDALVLVGTLLAYNIAPPEVRAALFESAKHIPGVVVIPDADALKSTVVLAVTGQYTRTELTLNTDTGELTGRRETVLTDDAVKGAPAGTVIFSETRTARFAETEGQV